MRISSTGADGFIGQHMVERLKDKHELEFLTEDLRDHAKVGFQIKQFDPEIIVHLAARTEVQDSFYEQISFSEVNYVGTVNLIEIAPTLSIPKTLCLLVQWKFMVGNQISDIIKEGKEEGIIAFNEATSQSKCPQVAKYGCEKYLEYAPEVMDYLQQ